ncbi:MAG: trimeric intracellular cation channel family protein [Bacteroidia bacterium]|nr:trimeric intracellular cation channel family protein [Bacteroidia bacterium]
MNVIYAADLVGTFVFAISGVNAARESKMDIFGAAVIAFVTAVGGGTVRDLLIGSTPVGWMKDQNYLVAIVLAIVVSVIFHTHIQKLTKTMFWFDTIGIGLFTVLGLQKTLDYGLSSGVALMMGIVSAVFGGVIRDTLSNRVPLIFRKEIYATACLAGGIIYLLLRETPLDHNLRLGLTVVATITIRSLAVYKKWAFPPLK